MSKDITLTFWLKTFSLEPPAFLICSCPVKRHLKAPLARAAALIKLTQTQTKATPIQSFRHIFINIYNSYPLSSNYVHSYLFTPIYIHFCPILTVGIHCNSFEWMGTSISTIYIVQSLSQSLLFFLDALASLELTQSLIGSVGRSVIVSNFGA